MADLPGIDVGSTFTDPLLINEADSSLHAAEVPFAPADSAIDAPNEIARVGVLANLRPGAIQDDVHGTMVWNSYEVARSSHVASAISAVN